MVTADQSASGGSILLGDGNGSLGARTAYAAGATTAYATVGDVNADGRPDIVTANESANTATLLLGSGGSCVTGTTASASTFSFTASEQCYVVPAGVTSLHVVATGGGGRTQSTSFGAVATGDIAVTPGQTLYVEVGGDAFYGNGWNGGGTFSGGLSSGGGASDVRTCGNAFCALTGGSLSDPRLIVAGGAGGTGQTNNGGGYGGSAGPGGNGGLAPGAGAASTPSMGVGSTGGGAGTASAGGAAGTGASGNGVAGSVGQGAAACNDSCGSGGSGGGGGGGWFGGGSGGSGNGGGGGGAGSNFGPALTGFTTASTSAGSVVLTPVVPAPTVSSAATITGEALKGATLTGAATFSGAASTTYLWQRCDSAGASCTGTLATTTGYTPVAADVGSRLKFVATGTNTGGSTSSAATTAVIAASRTTTYLGDGTPADAAGTYPGAWSGSPAYTTDRNENPNSAFAFSGGSAVVAPAEAAAFGANDWTASFWIKADPATGGRQVIGTRPGCFGGGFDVRVGDTGMGIEVWYSGGYTNTSIPDDIDDGTWHQITLSKAGSTLSAGLDGVRRGSTTVSGSMSPGVELRLGNGGCVGYDATSPLTGALDDVTLVNGLAGPLVGTAAAVAGTEESGQTLTASAAFTGTSPTTTYAWRRCDSAGAGCAAIPGATSASYTLTAVDVGHRLESVVTGTNAAGTASSRATTGVIASGNTAPSAGGDQDAIDSDTGQTAHAVTGAVTAIEVSPTLADAQGVVPGTARIVSIPANTTLQRTDGTAVAAGDDVALSGGRLRLRFTASTPADAVIGYRLLDAADSALLSAPSTISVDVVPAVSIDGGPGDGSSSTDASPSFSFSGAGAGGSYTCEGDGAGVGVCSSPKQLPPLRWGVHSLRIEATDAEGDSAARTVTWTVTGSLSAPTILAGPPAESGDRSATVSFQGEPGAVPQCSLDGADFAWCASPASYDNLPLGPHVFRVRQVDLAGNVSGAATRRWRIDIDFKPGDDGANIKSVKGLVNTDAAPTDNLLGVGCQLNRGSLRQCDVQAYADTGASRKARRTSRRNRGSSRRATKASLTLIGSGTTTLPERGQTSAVVDVKLNAAGRRLMKDHPEGAPITLKVAAQPFDTDQEFQTTTKSTLHPPQMLIVPSRGMFAGDSYELGTAGLQYVKAVAKLLDGAKRVRCEGYSDGSASDKRAKAVGYLRAKAVCDALEEAGVKANVGATGIGSDRPRGSNSTAAGRRLNRRVEIRVWF